MIFVIQFVNLYRLQLIVILWGNVNNALLENLVLLRH
jgi:hypothetical protein